MNSNLPLGAENDPRAPFNEKKSEKTKCNYCDNKARYYEKFKVKTKNGSFYQYVYYCHDCLLFAFQYDLPDFDGPISLEEYMDEQGIFEL